MMEKSSSGLGFISISEIRLLLTILGNGNGTDLRSKPWIIWQRSGPATVLSRRISLLGGASFTSFDHSVLGI